MIAPRRRVALSGLAVGGALTATYLGLVTGAVPLDVGVGRRNRPLGPQQLSIAAPRETVFDIIATPYGERAPQALREKVQVLERSTDMVLAAHYTPIRGRLKAVTVETVRFKRPHRVDFRLVRGPVPHVTESFELDESGGATTLRYTGEMGTDLWALGERWGDVVVARWESVVADSLLSIQHEAERQAGQRDVHADRSPAQS